MNPVYRITNKKPTAPLPKTVELLNTETVQAWCEFFVEQGGDLKDLTVETLSPRRMKVEQIDGKIVLTIP